LAVTFALPSAVHGPENIRHAIGSAARARAQPRAALSLSVD
jgi:hypothetical protein